MKEIDIATWARKSHYEWFSKFSNPCFGICVRMDVTKIVLFCKEHNISFYGAVIYAVSKSLNNIRPFRYRILNERVVEISRANAAYTVAANDGFVNTRTQTDIDLLYFCSEVRKAHMILKNASMSKSFNDTTVIDDFYFSCTPWIDFLSITEPIPENMPENNSIPRICWGRYVQENDKLMMSMNITVSHALVDGKDVADAFLTIQRLFDMPETLL